MKSIKNTPWTIRDEKIYDCKGRYVTATARDLAIEITTAVNEYARLIELSEKLLAEVRAQRGDRQSEELVSEAIKYLKGLYPLFQ